MTITYKTADDIERMREAGRLASEVLDYITPFIQPGISALAVSIGTYRGAYAILVLVPSARMPQRFTEVLGELLAVRDAMEKLLGTPIPAGTAA